MHHKPACCCTFACPVPCKLPFTLILPFFPFQPCYFLATALPQDSISCYPRLPTYALQAVKSEAAAVSAHKTRLEAELKALLEEQEEEAGQEAAGGEEGAVVEA